jgi:thiamine-monophosphate kinase
VTGTIGDAALGLRARKEADAAKNWKLDAAMRDHLLGRYLTPRPRSALAEAVQAHAAAAIDVSDGLAGDLTKLCRVSGVSAEINASSVPLSAAAQTALASDAQLMETILTGGDDYEIVCAMKADKVPTFRASAAMADIAVTDIGVVVDGTDEPRFIGAHGPLSFARKSFSHF